MLIRPTLWFVTASLTVTMVHELAHASTAFALGVRSTLYHYAADLDPTPAQAAANLPAIIQVAGPVCGLALGLISWLAFRRGRHPQLPLLYLSVFGLGTFFGNLMSTSFVGDFSRAAVALGLPMTVRYAITIVGGVSLAAIHVWAGRELIRAVPAHVGRLAGTLAIVVLPVVAGTAAVVLVKLPMPSRFVGAGISESSFWLFAAIAALVSGARSPSRLGSLEPRWADVGALAVAILVVRLAVRGIPFAP